MVISTFNKILEQIHQALGNLVRTFNIKDTYVDKDNPWLVILSAEEFTIRSIWNRLKCYSPKKLVFGHDMITSIKHTVGWELISQQNQTKINKDDIRKNNKRVDHD